MNRCDPWTGRALPMNWERYLGWLVLGWRLARGVGPGPECIREWQAGRWLPTYDDLAEVERLAELPPKAITSLAGLLRVPVDADVPSLADADELCHKALTGEATAAEWSDLGWLVRTHPQVAPTGDELETLILQLLNALPRGVKHAYRLMRVAALDVASVPELRDPVVEGIRICLEDVEGPAFLEPIGLLDQLSTPHANGLILDLMERPRSRPQRRYAAGLATQVLLRGGFSESERARVVMNVLAGWRSDPTEAEADLGELVDALPSGLATVLGRTLPHTGKPPAGDPVELDAAEDVAEPHASKVSDLITTRALDHAGSDANFLGPLLQDVLRQALFFRNAERRLRAGQVLSSSPFAPAVAEGIVDLMNAPDATATVRRRAGALLNNVVSQRQVLRMLPLVADDDLTVAASVTTAFGHTSYSEVSDLVIRQSVPAERLPMGRACLYALGMTGSPGIAVMAASKTVPKWQRHTATWWHEQGTAIHA